MLLYTYDYYAIAVVVTPRLRYAVDGAAASRDTWRCYVAADALLRAIGFQLMMLLRHAIARR